jgi:hypothetical protein
MSPKLIFKTLLKYCNGFDQRVARQQLCKHEYRQQQKENWVFCAVRPYKQKRNGVMRSVAKQRLCKYTKATVQTVFYGVRA